jgi:Tfp pilus assembly protein PilX
MKVRNNSYKKKGLRRGGFILPLTMLLMTLILLVSFGITSIIVRQARFSRIIKDSLIAYNAADMAITCTSFIDNTFTNSSTTNGIFPTDRNAYPIGNETAEINDTIAVINLGRDTRALPRLPNGSDDLTCGGKRIFNTSDTQISYSAFTYTKSDLSTENGKTSTFNLKIPLSNGDFRCAKVIYNKSQSFNQIISSGYSNCDASAKSRVERVIISSAESS